MIKKAALRRRFEKVRTLAIDVLWEGADRRLYRYWNDSWRLRMDGVQWDLKDWGLPRFMRAFERLDLLRLHREYATKGFQQALKPYIWLEC